MKYLVILLSVFIFIYSCKNEPKLSSMDITEILKIEDAKKYNKHLDLYLKTTDTIAESVTDRFWEAYQYGTATPVQWLEKKLSVIEKELENGKKYSIPNADGHENIQSVTDFKQWISKTYPDLVE